MSNIRIPRPYGFTQVMVEYHQTKDVKLFEIARGMIIQQWLIRNGNIFGRDLNPYELAQFLHCNPSDIQAFMGKQMLTSKLFDKDKTQEIVETLISSQIAWSLEDRIDIERQLDILKSSQGGVYKPFISAEVVKALSLKQSSTQNIGAIIGKLSGGGTINIFNDHAQQNNTQNLTMNQAIEIIQQEKDNLINGTYSELAEANYDLKSLPEVRANKQSSSKGSKEGLSLKNVELKQSIDNYQGSLKEADNTHHEMRREIELGIDLDATDPEIVIYK